MQLGLLFRNAGVSIWIDLMTSYILLSNAIYHRFWTNLMSFIVFRDCNSYNYEYLMLKTYSILIFVYVSTNLVQRLGVVASLVEKKNQNMTMLV